MSSNTHAARYIEEFGPALARLEEIKARVGVTEAGSSTMVFELWKELDGITAYEFHTREKIVDHLEFVVSRWIKAGSITFDIEHILASGRDAFDMQPDEAALCTLPGEVVFIHFGHNTALQLRHGAHNYIDGCYLQSVEDGSGIAATFVCDDPEWGKMSCEPYYDVLRTVTRIACGRVSWAALGTERSNQGFTGDRSVTRDPALLRAVSAAKIALAIVNSPIVDLSEPLSPFNPLN